MIKACDNCGKEFLTEADRFIYENTNKGDYYSCGCKEKLETIKDFVESVEAKAEQAMLITGKLEGAHYAAMKSLVKEMGNKPPLVQIKNPTKHWNPKK